MNMIRMRLVAGIVIAPLTAIALASLGCGGGEKKADMTKTTPTTKSARTVGSKSGSASEKTELKPTAFATIKGKVTYDGTPPTPADLPIPDSNKDKSFCLTGPHKDQTWTVGPDKGVANVVVWIRPPKDKYFVVPADQQKPAETSVKINQPHCAFEPHVAVIFPTYYDPASKEQKSTGQTFEVTNTAPIAHNTDWNPKNPLVNTPGNQIIKSKDNPLPIRLKAAPQNKPDGEDLIQFKCDIHTWMRAYVWAFNHPWAAVTKEDGSYEIKNVPAGSELYLVGWHEPNEYVLPQGNGTRDGMQIGPLKEGETKEVNFTVK
jgi:hypothetical protein